MTNSKAKKKLTPKIKTNQIEGSVLTPAASIHIELSKSMSKLIRDMYLDVKREMVAAFNETPLPDSAMDASITSQARIRLNLLTDKWTKKFGALAKFASQRMVDRVVKNSEVTVRMSLKEVAKDLTVDLTGSNAMLDEIIKASTQEAAGLIKRIPEKFLGEVQGQVMRSITTGKGIEDLVPYLTKRYEGDVKWARHVALDQTRKAYTSVNQVRLQSLGCESFIWIHSGGSAHPRKDHIEMNGKEYRFDDPPVVNKKTGERGLPSSQIFCRCVLKPVFRLEKNAA